MRSWKLGLWLFLSSPVLAGAQTGTSAPSDDWEFALTPIFWGAGMEGTVGFAAQERDFEVSSQDLLGSLEFAFMANFEARKDRWSFSVDTFYADLGEEVVVENASVPLPEDLKLNMSTALVEGDVGYQLASSLDVLAGIRRVSASAGLTADAGTLPEADGGFTDPIVGARFRRDLTEKLWVNLRGDVGGFGVGSDFSWFVGAAAGIRVSKLISLDFGYRIWDFDYESDEELKRLDLALAGFGGGLTSHF
jgi:hypothetical protein